MEISLYIFNDFIKNLGRLFETILQKENRAILVCHDEELKAIDLGLWTYSQLAFLPHGTLADPFHGEQPILLVNQDAEKEIISPSNKAQVLVSVDVIPEYDKLQHYEKSLIICYRIDFCSILQDKELTNSENSHPNIIRFISSLKALQRVGLSIYLVNQAEEGKWNKKLIDKLS